MKKNLLTALTAFFPAVCLFAQVGVGTTTLAASEALHIESKATASETKYKGFLPTRVALVDPLTLPDPVVTPKLNLMVYNPDANPTKEGITRSAFM